MSVSCCSTSHSKGHVSGISESTDSIWPGPIVPWQVRCWVYNGCRAACRDFNSLPMAQPLSNLTLQQLLLQPDSSSEQETAASSSSSSSYIGRPGQQLLNTCSSEALCELLRHLKRAYWPFPWDTNVDCYDRGGRGSTGGFRCACLSLDCCGAAHCFKLAATVTCASSSTYWCNLLLSQGQPVFELEPMAQQQRLWQWG